MSARSLIRKFGPKGILKHYGPGPHPGTGTEQTVHGSGGGVGLKERPEKRPEKQSAQGTILGIEGAESMTGHEVLEAFAAQHPAVWIAPDGREFQTKNDGSIWVYVQHPVSYTEEGVRLGMRLIDRNAHTGDYYVHADANLGIRQPDPESRGTWFRHGSSDDRSSEELAYILGLTDEMPASMVPPPEPPPDHLTSYQRQTLTRQREALQTRIAETRDILDQSPDPFLWDDSSESWRPRHFFEERLADLEARSLRVTAQLSGPSLFPDETLPKHEAGDITSATGKVHAKVFDPTPLPDDLDSLTTTELGEAVFVATIELEDGSSYTSEIIDAGYDWIRGRIVDDETGGLIGFFERSSLEPGNEAVYNSSFRILPEYQGRGIGTLFLAHWEQELGKAGFEYMELSAADVGRYAWIVSGYEPNDLGAIAHHVEHYWAGQYDFEAGEWLDEDERFYAEDAAGGADNMQAIIDWVETYNNEGWADPLDLAMIGAGTGNHVGKEIFLSGPSWSGRKYIGHYQKAADFRSAYLKLWAEWALTNPAAIEQDAPEWWKAVRALKVVKHYGPGDHPSGSPQSAHGKGGGSSDSKGRKGKQDAKTDIDLPPGWPKTFLERLTRCYELSGKLVMLHDAPGTLVHGTIQGFGNPPIDHAWIELDDGRVYDAVLDRYFTQEAWDAYANPVEEARYTPDEARRAAVKTEHWGPWHEEVNKHYGPGEHPGTGTSQDVHGSGSGSGLSPEFEAKMSERKRQQAELRRRLSLGELTMEEAKAEGYHSLGHDHNGWEPLPDRLYHVTTAADAVYATGLKTRAELGQARGKGLGGGENDSISFTTDPDIAESIKNSMLEARLVARGEKTIDDMLAEAEQGGFRDDLYRFFGGQVGDDGMPLGLKWLREGYTYKHNIMGGKSVAEIEAMGGKLAPDATVFGNGSVSAWLEPLSPEEMNERVFNDVYKPFAALREMRTGQLDPLFFSSDVAGLAAIDPDQIQVIEVKPVPGAQGYQMGALGEWRTGTGDAVEVLPPVHGSGSSEEQRFTPISSADEIDVRPGHYYHSTDAKIVDSRLKSKNELLGYDWRDDPDLEEGSFEHEVAHRGSFVWGTSRPQTEYGSKYIYEFEGTPSDEGYYEDFWFDPENNRITRRFELTTNYRGGHQPTADYGAPAHDLTQIVSEDIYDHPEWYMHPTSEGYRESVAFIRQVRGNPDAEVTIYRAVPKGVETINPGDWVTPSREYAQIHGESNLNNDYDILERKVTAKEVIWPGDYLPEWGWFPDNELGKRMLKALRLVKHYGPGAHPGTGTSQDVHGRSGTYKLTAEEAFGASLVDDYAAPRDVDDPTISFFDTGGVSFIDGDLPTTPEARALVSNDSSTESYWGTFEGTENIRMAAAEMTGSNAWEGNPEGFGARPTLEVGVDEDAGISIYAEGIPTDDQIAYTYLYEIHHQEGNGSINKSPLWRGVKAEDIPDVEPGETLEWGLASFSPDQATALRFGDALFRLEPGARVRNTSDPLFEQLTGGSFEIVEITQERIGYWGDRGIETPVYTLRQVGTYDPDTGELVRHHAD